MTEIISFKNLLKVRRNHFWLVNPSISNLLSLVCTTNLLIFHVGRQYILISFREWKCLMDSLLAVTWQSQKPIHNLFCFCSLNRRDMSQTLPRNGKATWLFYFPPSSDFFPFSFPFHILLAHGTMCIFLTLRLVDIFI